MDSSPAIGSDGRLYVGSDDQNLYCFTDASSTTPTLMPPLPPTPTPIPPLAVEPGPLTAGEQFTLDLSLTQDLTRAFDLYLIADTPYGPYTVFLDGRIAAGIEPLYCNVPGYAAPYSATVRPGAKIPASMAGATVTFYLATVEAGKIPPVASLQELGPASPYVMTFDKAQALVN